MGFGAFLLVAAALMNWGYTFADKSVTNQLANQKISFPAANTPGLTSLPEADRAVIAQYAGMQLTTGKQAQAYADHYMAVHIRGIGGGKTYSEISGMAIAATAAAAKAPTDPVLAALVGGLLMLVLSLLGLNHLRRTPEDATI
jgi:hypothetical protein